jgi:predicted MFS family arabinose efflux permease
MVLSGLISIHFGWRACFYSSVPGLILVYFVLKINEAKHEHHVTDEVNFQNIFNLFKSSAYVVTLIAGIMLTLRHRL